MRANRKPSELPSVEEISQDVSYDPETGAFRWLKPHLMPKGGIKAPAGRIAGGANRAGYWTLCVRGVAFLGHRLAWYIVHGTSPVLLDHINGDILDNRIANLRPADESQNNQNRRVLKSSKLGVKGVRQIANGKYRARISVRGKRRLIGDFDTVSDAGAAYARAAAASFGEYARVA